MNQLSLLPEPPAPRRRKPRASAAAPIAPPRVTVIARSKDPSTSHEAAASLQADQPRLQRSVEVVVALLSESGPMSDFDIAASWSDRWGKAFSESLPRKARHWARQAGLVVEAGYAEHLGRRVLLWKAADHD